MFILSDLGRIAFVKTENIECNSLFFLSIFLFFIISKNFTLPLFEVCAFRVIKLKVYWCCVVPVFLKKYYPRHDGWRLFQKPVGLELAMRSADKLFFGMNGAIQTMVMLFFGIMKKMDLENSNCTQYLQKFFLFFG